MYTLDGPNETIKMLHYKGKRCHCPYAAVNSMPLLCSTVCPQFEVDTKSNTFRPTEENQTVTLHCTGRKITIGETA
jgi:hypothetical protein